MNKDIVILKGDKDSSIALMNRSDYIEKLEVIIDDGIKKGIHEVTTDSTLQDLKRFQDFLYINFREYERYKIMYPKNNRPTISYMEPQRRINLTA